MRFFLNSIPDSDICCKCNQVSFHTFTRIESLPVSTFNTFLVTLISSLTPVASDISTNLHQKFFNPLFCLLVLKWHFCLMRHICHCSKCTLNYEASATPVNYRAEIFLSQSYTERPFQLC